MRDIIYENSKNNLVENFDEIREIYENDDLSQKQKSLKIRSKLSKYSDSKWTIIEETFLELEVEYRTQLVMDQIEKLPPVTKRIERLQQILDENFKDYPDIAKILIDSVPDQENIRRWLKKPEWKEEVDKRMRDESLFSAENRHKMIQAVFKQGLTGSAKHAEMYLKMSGDIGKTQEKDPVEDTFEKMSNALFRKKSEN